LSYAIRNEKLMTGDKILLDEGAMGNASVGDLPGGSVNIPDEVSQWSGKRFTHHCRPIQRDGETRDKEHRTRD
jgi:hypothetical protein